MRSTAAMAAAKTGDGLGEAVLSPLEDFNLRRDPVPTLLKASNSPYEMNDVMRLTCDEIAFKIAELDAILGEDFDFIPPEEAEKTDAEKAEKRADQASDFTLDYIADEARGFIPFRGAIRYVSGANRHEKKLKRALAIGAHRRSFLKGIGLAKGCLPPAAPNPTPEPEPMIVFREDAPSDWSTIPDTVDLSETELVEDAAIDAVYRAYPTRALVELVETTAAGQDGVYMVSVVMSGSEKARAIYNVLVSEAPDGSLTVLKIEKLQ